MSLVNEADVIIPFIDYLNYYIPKDL